MPKVYNKHHKDAPADAVYVGRPSRWGNPFEIGKDGTREEVVAKYLDYAKMRMRQAPDDIYSEFVKELRGKDLVCWCAPAPCHADVLLILANGDKC